MLTLGFVACSDASPGHGFNDTVTSTADTSLVDSTPSPPDGDTAESVTEDTSTSDITLDADTQNAPVVVTGLETVPSTAMLHQIPYHKQHSISGP